MEVLEIVDGALGGQTPTRDELEVLYAVDPASKEARIMQWAADRIAREASGNKAEIHAQVGLDASPCAKDCNFCSFAEGNGLRKERYELSLDEVRRYTDTAIEDGAGYMLYMCTANYHFEKLLETISKIREDIGGGFPLIASAGDLTPERAKQLKDVGCNGIYHALRLDEGVLTPFDPETRKQTIINAHAAGLNHCMTLEPIGPEHTPAQLADMTEYIKSTKPIYSGAWRRGVVEGSARPFDTIPERTLAVYTAAFRLAVGKTMRVNLTGANTTLISLSGANASCIEYGPNPRDHALRTEDNVGYTAAEVKEVFNDSGWDLRTDVLQEWIDPFED